jgi:hypothetical protein
MIIADLQGRKYIDNSSSGLTICDAETALKEGVGPNKKTILVIGEHAAQVCEGLPPEGVGRLVDKYYGKIDTFILVGERMRCIGSDKAIYCSNLDEGIKHALASSSVNDTIVSCVKCFR